MFIDGAMTRAFSCSRDMYIFFKSLDPFDENRASTELSNKIGVPLETLVDVIGLTEMPRA